jgi:hypothetical protein
VLKSGLVRALLIMAASVPLGYLATAGGPPAAPADVRAPAQKGEGGALPYPDPPFEGVANRTLAGSKPDFPHPVTAPADAPNVLLVLVDDAGFGSPSTFGGPCQTPTLTRLAGQGPRYNRFHVTALCSPTRAALLSGRNHHAVGFGSIAEIAGGWPGYMEVYAGFQENADYEIGRVVQSIEDMGLADDTMIIYIWGDNGSSMEGTETGSCNEITMQNGITGRGESPGTQRPVPVLQRLRE